MSRTPSLAELLASRELPKQPVDMLNPPALPEHRFWRQWLAAAVVVFAGSAAHAASNSPAVGVFAMLLVILSLVAFEVEARRCPDASWAGLRPLLVEPGPAGWHLFAHHFAAHYESECRRVGLGDWLDAGTLVLERAELGPDGFIMVVRGPRAEDHAREFAAALNMPGLTVASADARGAVFIASPVATESVDRATLRAVLTDVGIDAGPDRLDVASVEGVPSADLWQVAVRGPSAVLADFDTDRLQRMAAVAGVRSVTVREHDYSDGRALIFAFRRTEPVSPTAAPRACTWRHGSNNAVIIGRDEMSGEEVSLNLAASNGHLALQGATRSGKSVAAYVLLGGLAQDVQDGTAVIGGLDPSGLLLAPFDTAPGGQFRAVGVSDAGATLAAVQAAVSEMDERIVQLRRDRTDKLTPSAQHPMLVVVLEEYPGLLAWLSSSDLGRKPGDRVTGRVKAAVQRLVQEGAKVGIRVVMIAQRFDAAIIDGAVRSNLALRCTLRVDNADAVKMLHPGATSKGVQRVRAFAPGQAVLEVAGQRPRLLRFDNASYRDYFTHVEGVLGCSHE